MCVLAVVFQSCKKEEPGTLKGEFSVSQTQKVKFSSGNLQYDVTANVWQFADHQWDVLGSKNNALDDEEENFKGVIDLFSFGSADNATLNDGEKHEFTEWGKNPIVNAANEPNEWRTLTAKEVEYLIRERPNALSLFFLATVGEVKGMVILPDNFENKDSVKLYVMKESDYDNRFSAVDFANGDSLLLANKYSIEEFTKLEQGGAVFLPFGGQKFLKVEDNKEGDYWCIADKDINDGSTLSVTIYSAWPNRGCNPERFRNSVRLVKDVK